MRHSSKSIVDFIAYQHFPPQEKQNSNICSEKKKKSKLCFFLSYYFYCLRFLLDYDVAL